MIWRRRAPPPPPAYGGWARVDTDHVLRGWATDRADRARRLTIEVRIDDEVIAAVVANRLDPRLTQTGEGDGCYAFDLVIPERWRDGTEHAFEACVQDSGFSLKTKDDRFTIPAEAAVPRVTLARSGLGFAEGRLTGGQFSKSVGLELWRDGSRLDAAVETDWSGPVDDRAFAARFAPAAFGDSDHLILAAPGMVEAGMAVARLNNPLTLTAGFDAAGRMTVRVGGVDRRSDLALQVLIHDGDRGEPALTAPIAQGERIHRLALSASLTGRPLSVGLDIDGWRPACLRAPARRPDRLTRDSALRAGAHWDLPQGGAALADGGFRVEARSPGVILRQALTVLPLPGQVQAAARLRAPPRTRLIARLVDEAGRVLAKTGPIEGRGDDWIDADLPMLIRRPLTTATLELLVSGPPGPVDVVGLRLGGAVYEDPALTVDEAFVCLNNLYVVGETLGEGVAMDLAFAEGDAPGRRRVRLGPDGDAGGPVAYIASFEISAEVYGLALGGALRGVLTGPAGDLPLPRINPDRQADQVAAHFTALLALSEGRPIERSLLLALREGRLQTESSKAVIAKVEHVAVGQDHTVLAGGWIAGAGEPGALLVDEVTLRYWPLAAEAVVYARQDAAAYLGKRDDGAPAGFLLCATAPAAQGALAVVRRQDDRWLLGARLDLIKAAAADSAPTLEFVRRLAHVAPERLNGVLAAFGPAPQAPLEVRPRTRLAFGPAWESARPRVTIVVPLYREPFLLTHVVDMQRLAPDDVAWVLVNDYPADEAPLRSFLSRRTVAFRQPTLFLSQEHNLGFAGASNLGAAEGASEYILLMNSDVYLRSFDAVARAVAAMDADPTIGVCGFRLLYPDGSLQHGGMSFRASSRHGGLVLLDHPGKGLQPPPASSAPVAVPAVTGALMLVRRSDFDGPVFDDGYPVGDFEDADLCLRMTTAGKRVVLIEADDLFHLERQSISATARRDIRHAVTLVNSATFTRRWGATLAAAGALA